MYKVFLVEDEIIVRESMRESFAWEKNGFLYAGEAEDGEMALPMIEEIQPHIVITDIRMPFLDGLALSRILRKNMPWLKIIILTGHNEFDYAKQAISVGINEFVLKPIDSEDLLEILNKTADELRAEEAEREKLNRLADLQKQQNDYLISVFLNDLVIGALDAGAVIGNASKLNIDIIAPYYSVLLLETDSAKEGSERYSELLKLDGIIAQLSENNPDIISFKRNIKEHILIVKGHNRAEVDNTGYQISTAVKAEVEDKTACGISISIGGVKERVHGIAESFNEARQTKRFSFMFGNNKIIGVEDTKLAGLRIMETLPFAREDVENFLKQGRTENLDHFINHQISRLSGRSRTGFALAFIYFNVMFEVCNFISELEGDSETVLGETQQKIPDFDGWVRNTNLFAVCVGRILKSAVEFRDEKKLNRYNNVIIKAKEFIDTNYHRSDLSLADVADTVNISSSHFSTIFSQENGNTFIEYLTGIRVNKAKELLHTSNMKSSEIAYAVGYNDSHYFCHIFKKATGFSPGQFRNGKLLIH